MHLFASAAVLTVIDRRRLHTHRRFGGDDKAIAARADGVVIRVFSRPFIETARDFIGVEA